MRFILKIGVFSLVVASLALVGPQVECRGLSSLMGKLSKEWQWIDSFLKEGSSRDRINKYFAENQAQLEEPKLRDAFKLVVDAINMNPEETGCSESESLKVANLFDALNMDMNAELDPKASALRGFALKRRQEYGNFCAEVYSEKLLKLIDNNMVWYRSPTPNLPTLVRTDVERFGLGYSRDRDMQLKDLFNPKADRIFHGAGFATTGPVARSIRFAMDYKLSDSDKKMNEKSGKREYPWLELVEDLRKSCSQYCLRVHDALENISKDAVVSRSLDQLKLNIGTKIWRSWISTVACDQLKKFDNEKLAEKLSAAEAKS